MKNKKERGFTLIEVLAALGILSIALSVQSSYLVNNLRNNMNTQIRYEGIQAAQSVIDELRFKDISTLSGQMNENLLIGNRTYSVAVTYCQMPQYCISNEIVHISLVVTYKAKVVYETDTVFSAFK